MPIKLSSDYRPEVHGHRGCRGLRPENTIPAFLHALALGVDILEMDVVISQDHKVVVSHESWLNPAFCLDPNGHTIEATFPPRFNLYQMTYDVISRCDCGQLGHPSFPLQQARAINKPLLSEVLRVVEESSLRLGRAPVSFSIEIKSTPEGDSIYHPEPAQFLALVLADLIAAQVLDRTTLLCFDARILQLAHQRYPELAICLLIEADQLWLPSIQSLGFVPATFGPDCSTVTTASVQELRTAFPTLRLVPWTVNKPADMQRLINIRVDGITTDFPDVLLSLLSAQTTR